MAADFVPLFPTLTAKDGRSVPPNLPVRAAGETAVCHSKGELKVDLKREGDRVTQIRIQCRCGEIIELACEY